MHQPRSHRWSSTLKHCCYIAVFHHFSYIYIRHTYKGTPNMTHYLRERGVHVYMVWSTAFAKYLKNEVYEKLPSMVVVGWMRFFKNFFFLYKVIILAVIIRVCVPSNAINYNLFCVSMVCAMTPRVDAFVQFGGLCTLWFEYFFFFALVYMYICRFLWCISHENLHYKVMTNFVEF